MILLLKKLLESIVGNNNIPTMKTKKVLKISEDGKTVLGVYDKKITSVVIPDSIETIEGFAFSDCSLLKKIELPKNLKSIGYHAFSNCNSLTSIKIPGDAYISQEEAKVLGELSQIPEPSENHYNKKIEKLLNIPLSKDMFKEHSLFLMKEHCKLFSPYSNKARELLDKLIQL